VSSTPCCLHLPTYEYQCQKCGHRFDVFQRIVDPPVRNCPKCKRKNCVEQIISGGSGLIFKGSGFYETDYKRKPDRPADKPDTGASDTGTKSDTSED